MDSKFAICIFLFWGGVSFDAVQSQNKDLMEVEKLNIEPGSSGNLPANCRCLSITRKASHCGGNCVHMFSPSQKSTCTQRCPEGLQFTFRGKIPRFGKKNAFCSSLSHPLWVKMEQIIWGSGSSVEVEGRGPPPTPSVGPGAGGARQGLRQGAGPAREVAALQRQPSCESR